MSNFYERYPMMRPYLGVNFHKANTPSLLLIGESHYLPKGSSQHVSADTWYSSSCDSLSPEEIGWISTKKVLDEFLVESTSNAAFSIWSNALREINKYGPRYSDYKRVADDIAFYNFFLRPGLEGKSLAVSAQDVEFANEAFRAHHQALKPTAIIFLSMLAHKHLHQSESLSVPVIATPHPGCAWWNRVAKKYGGKKGRDILGDFIKTTNWPQSPQTGSS